MEDLNLNNLICFTVGHSNHEANHFIRLSKAHKINCFVDVRSLP